MPKKRFLKKKKNKAKDEEGNIIYSGCLEAWAQKKSGDEIHNYEPLWTKNIKEPGQCIWWDGTLNMVCMGCEKGTILVMRLNPKSPLKKVEHVNEKIHKDKVMGIWIDAERQHMVSISEDKNLVVFDLKSKTILSSKEFDFSIEKSF